MSCVKNRCAGNRKADLCGSLAVPTAVSPLVKPPHQRGNSAARAILATYDLLGHGDPADAVSDVNRLADTGADIGDIDQAGQSNDSQYLAPRRGQQQSTAPMPRPARARPLTQVQSMNVRGGQINDDPGSPGRCRRERCRHVRSISNVELPCTATTTQPEHSCAIRLTLNIVGALLLKQQRRGLDPGGWFIPKICTLRRIFLVPSVIGEASKFLRPAI